MLAQGLGNEFGTLHRLDGLVQAQRQRLESNCASLGFGQGPDVVLGACGQFIALFNALESGSQHYREGEVGVARAVEGTNLDTCAVALRGLVHRYADERRAIVMAPADPRGCLGTTGEALVGVHPLVGDRGDLGGVRDQARDE